MVLGHESCGAVKATVQGGDAPGHIGSIVKAIKPAIDSVRGRTADLPEVGMRANVVMTVQMLKTADPFLKPMFEKGELMIVGARYDLDDGRVDIMP
jgi:carbonic anhydrase